LLKTITDLGITIDFNRLSLKARSSIRSNREPLSNITNSSELHRKKHILLKMTTDLGITIDFNRLSPKARSSIRSNRESFSNITNSSELHRKKHILLKTITDLGITIDFNRLSLKADSSITSVVEPFSKLTTDTRPSTREHDFTDKEIQRRPFWAESESEEQTTPPSTVFRRLKAVETPGVSPTESS
jgi:hypothetical protein